jgi:molybdate transport system substrate-binding protein
MLPTPATAALTSPAPLAWLLAIPLLLAGAGLAGCGRGGGDAAPLLTVFAAASTTDACEELAARYGERTGRTLRLNLAASGTLAKQIAGGAPADVYVAANPRWMDFLQERGLLREGTRRDLLANRLVLVAPRGEGFAARLEPGFDLPGAFADRLALADPRIAPVGEYAEQALRALGWWDALAGRLAPASDVRAALRFVETGEAAAGIVYATDAAASSGVVVLGTFPADSHAPIRYPVAALRESGAAADSFLVFLRGPAAAEVFRRHGFTPLSG